MARAPEEIHAAFASALNTADLEALCALYDAQAVIVPQPGASVVQGQERIRQVLRGFLAMKPTMDITTQHVMQTDNLALLRSNWRLKGTAPDGKTIELAGHGTEVVKRQADGTWRFLLDHPWGAD